MTVPHRTPQLHHAAVFVHPTARAGKQTTVRLNSRPDRHPLHQSLLVRKVRFEVEKPLAEREEPSRARKKPAKPAPSTSKATRPVPALMEMDLPVPAPMKAAAAPPAKKPAATVRSGVHTAPKSAIKKKSAQSSAVTEAQIEAATPKKCLVIETPRLEQMVDIAKKAVQNLKAKKELPPSDPEPYRPTYGPTPKPSKVKRLLSRNRERKGHDVS